MREMKDSGVEWLKQIPAHWNVFPLKSIFLFGKGLPITKEDLLEEGVPVISYGQIHSKDNTGVTVISDLIRFVSGDFLESHSASLVHQGDFIFADTSEDLEGCGNCVYVDKNMTLFAGYHTIILACQAKNSYKYLAYLFQTDAWRNQIRSRVTGVKLYSISRKILGMTTLIMPPIEEQEKITAYLDAQTARIDEALFLNRAQIEELRLYKQSLITETVTRGLDPDAPMKDSGVDWIGAIPAHWNIQKGKNLFHETNERSIDGTEELLTVSHITGITPRSQKNVNMFLSLSLADYKICHIHDIAANTMWMWQGAIGVSDFHGVVSPSYNTYRQTNNDYLPKYLDYLLRCQALVDVYVAYSTGITKSRLRLYPEQFLSIMFPVPPIREQERMTAYLNSKCGKIDALISLKQSKIEKLTRYRQSLIYEYVTGKKEAP